MRLLHVQQLGVRMRGRPLTSKLPVSQHLLWLEQLQLQLLQCKVTGKQQGLMPPMMMAAQSRERPLVAMPAAD